MPDAAEPTCSELLARHAVDLRLEALPPAAVERAKHFFIDHLAVALRASAPTRPPPPASSCTRSAPPCRWSASRSRASATRAA